MVDLPEDYDPRPHLMSMITAFRQNNVKLSGQLLSELNTEEKSAEFLFLLGSFMRLVRLFLSDRDTSEDEFFQNIALNAAKETWKDYKESQILPIPCTSTRPHADHFWSPDSSLAVHHCPGVK